MRKPEELVKIADELRETVLALMSDGAFKTLEPSEYLFVQVVIVKRLLFATITLSDSILGSKTALEMYESLVQPTLLFLNDKRSSTDEKISNSITSINSH